ncbi:MAG: hypothetical protein BV457_00175 [Thermoplasmata archaeon M9B1D]|nr:MAG: hypothetical protein BV457_00175 [Thermoplasmata archaeon M9B1D]PNX52219.1 MAG: hypothetical protein BV456_00120 [Thermoplasmata archaeon M8B2D]
MKNYLKHFNKKYELGKCDCWTLIQDIFKEEHNIDLPKYPFVIEGNEKDFAKHLRANLLFEEIKEPKKTCIVHKSGINEHIGYCVGNNKYIHRTILGTKINKIPDRYCKFYYIKGVKCI